ncbi:helix-turn-helix domain-containing protein [Siphonobacter sp. SORGH_AS_1065]|uniref:AraC family transcriptional regulator n=1 Tax=Siphonobacter sp. SORGH_AS_1065 TaxID=3041795 RepID=UPI0027852668|nr:helix-turn-helix domain-containing protein [Siphonobacter sp. SORGH_AS_1065]MDQ1090218.1 AraC-like DNA-binding protein [Siphonobacter sp. SORGH_AS_1065]
MITYKQKPDSRLAGVIDHFYAVQIPIHSEPIIQHLSPNLELMLVFNFGDPIRYSFGNKALIEHSFSQVTLIGPLRQMLNYELKPGDDLLVIGFTLDGFFRFLSLEKITIESLTESESVLAFPSLNALYLSLADIPDFDPRVAYLTSHILRELSPSEDAASTLLEHASLFHQDVLNPVKVMADQHSLSERTVQLRFKKYVGYSPKELLRFLRFKKVIQQVINQPDTPWFDLIEAFGYHDQSHFIKDFKQYTGLSPKEFRKLQENGNFCISFPDRLY